jgi:hypothetical protein
MNKDELFSDMNNKEYEQEEKDFFQIRTTVVSSDS